MADDLCGPSNALKSLQNHQAVDRTPQKDQSSGGQHFLAQGFRSTNNRVAQNDASLAAFEAGPQLALPFPSPETKLTFGQYGAQGTSHYQTVPQPLFTQPPESGLGPWWVDEFGRNQDMQPGGLTDPSPLRRGHQIPESFTLEGQSRARFNASRIEELPDDYSEAGPRPAQGPLVVRPRPAQGALVMPRSFQGGLMMQPGLVQNRFGTSGFAQRKPPFVMPPAGSQPTMQPTQQVAGQTKNSKQQENAIFEAAFAQVEEQLAGAKITPRSPRSQKSTSPPTEKSDSPLIAQKTQETAKPQDSIKDEVPASKPQPKPNIAEMWGDEAEIEKEMLEQTSEDNSGSAELARVAGGLLESVKRMDSPKFRESKFLALMRGLRDREIVVSKDSFRLKDEKKSYKNVLDVLDRIEREKQPDHIEHQPQPDLALDFEWQPDETEMVGHRHALHPGGSKYPAK